VSGFFDQFQVTPELTENDSCTVRNLNSSTRKGARSEAHRSRPIGPAAQRAAEQFKKDFYAKQSSTIFLKATFSHNGVQVEPVASNQRDPRSPFESNAQATFPQAEILSDTAEKGDALFSRAVDTPIGQP